ncbi:MAG: CoA transferase, partial [Chloroflexi bacterium]|nr:CoA transferase [Chloroflexota bacterium]
LAASADILVESQAPGDLKALGLGYEDLRGVNPGLVYTSITPFGQDGPRRDWKGPDIVVQALGGLMYICGYPGGPPVRVAASQAYYAGSLYGCVATLIALYHRQCTGEGQWIDVSMQEAMALITQPTTQFFDLKREITTRGGTDGPRLGRFWPCRDGYISAGSFRRPQARERGLRWLESRGLAGELTEPQWQAPEREAALAARVEEAVLALVRRLPRSEVEEESRRFDLWISPLHSPSDVVEDPHLRARGFFLSMEHPALGAAFGYPGAPYRLSASPWRVSRRPPLLGEHNGEGWRDEDVGGRGKGDGGREPGPSPSPSSSPAPSSLHPAPLLGVRVLDLSWVAAGPLAAKVLADFGAEVILVESAVRRGGLRGGQPMVPGLAGWNVSNWFNNLNTSKLGLTLNLGRPAGIELVRRLVQVSDVVLDNYTTGVMGRWGLTYAELQLVRPDIIAVSMPVMGTTGPRREHGSFGNGVAALAGLPLMSAVPGRPPPNICVPFTDHSSNPCHAATAIMAALLYRRRTGRGQFVDLAQYEATACVSGSALLEYTVNGQSTTPLGNRSVGAAPHGVYPCAGEDNWCAIAVTSEVEWQAFRFAIDDPPWTRRETFSTLESRLHNQDELDERVATWTRTREASEVMDLLQKAGVPAGAVQNAADLLTRDPQLRARGHFLRLEHPEAGPTSHHALPFRLSRTPPRFLPAPLLGQHNDYVLGQVLGLPEEEINRLIVDGVAM